jgi:tetratricopeptide (TPR) repeat protein
VKPLEPPESFHLSAAVGWLELGNHLEANEELEKITPQLRVHPDVLMVSWQIYAKGEQWASAFEIARSLVELVPDDSFGWIHQAYALRRMPGGGINQAWDALLPAADKFPKEALIPYNLSCYASQMGQLDQAKQWLQRAIELGDPMQIKLMALNDRDLQPLWKSIRETC